MQSFVFSMITGVVPQSAPPVPTASSRFHFPPLDAHSPPGDVQSGRFSASSLTASGQESNNGTDRKVELSELEDGSAADWRRGVDLMASRNAVGGGGIGHQKRKPDIMLPLFTRPGMYPDPHSPFAVSPIPSRGGVLSVPISPALSLTPTIFSYSPSPGLSPFNSSCFSFNPEEMKHYLHSQACSVFNYHLSPRTFPRYPGLMVPPLQCQMHPEESTQFSIKLQPPPIGRKNRERAESTEESAPVTVPTVAPIPPRIKVEPTSEKDTEGLGQSAREKEEHSQDEGTVPSRTIEEEKGTIFARPTAPPAWPSVPISTPSEEPPEVTEDSEDRSGKEPSAPEKKEDALMPPKLRLKRRWNDDPEARELNKTGKFFWSGAGPRGLAAAAADA
ncbi:PREDICTED: ETS translocation variant 3 [Dipodomys ordii]|uniref:ETS translocation variant 3 n=1 Tax=Dipodomys ordii TaxID=10020 RepID=A0A1S3GV84_DIPOR|nr:PREDICTED: ETS translocation variant 3 [Dipodomys ordii]